MSLRRGFKHQADQLAGEVRGELGLDPTDPLDPWRLAALLEIPVLPLYALAAEAAHGVNVLTGSESGSFSAATVFAGQRRLIVHNDSHAIARQRSNLCHELAHGLLLHAPSSALDDHGCRRWNLIVEEEADWLAGALLVTPEAALHTARNRLSLQEAAERYGVSQAMMRWRMNVTGAQRRVRRWAS